MFLGSERASESRIEMPIGPSLYTDDVIFIRYVAPPQDEEIQLRQAPMTPPRILRLAEPVTFVDLTLTPPIILRDEPDIVMMESDEEDDDPSSDWELE